MTHSINTMQPQLTPLEQAILNPNNRFEVLEQLYLSGQLPFCGYIKLLYVI